MVAVDMINYSKYTIELKDCDEGCVIRSYQQNKQGYQMKITHHPNKLGYSRWKIRLTNDEGKQNTLIVARLIMQYLKPDEWDEKLQTDHIDFNPLNNRIDNLRMISQKENLQNKSSKPTKANITSGHKNIHYNKLNKRWEFRKRIKELTYFKSFKTIDEALEFKKIFLIIHNCK